MSHLIYRLTRCNQSEKSDVILFCVQALYSHHGLSARSGPVHCGQDPQRVSVLCSDSQHRFKLKVPSVGAFNNNNFQVFI